MTSLECKMEEVKEKFKRAKPIRRTFYNTCVMGYGPLDDEDDDYIEMVYGVAGQWRDD